MKLLQLPVGLYTDNDNVTHMSEIVSMLRWMKQQQRKREGQFGVCARDDQQRTERSIG